MEDLVFGQIGHGKESFIGIIIRIARNVKPKK